MFAIEAQRSRTEFIWLRVLAVLMVMLFVFSPLVVIKKSVFGSLFGALLSAVALCIYLPAVIFGVFSVFDVTISIQAGVAVYLFLGLMVLFFIISVLYLCVGWHRKFGRSN